LAGGTEDDVRQTLRAAAAVSPSEWVEEALLQTYLFAGFPRALNGMREWRRMAGPATTRDDRAVRASDVRTRGETTCARVYGSMYERLRANVRLLHVSLDDWMITEGYGKVLSRDGLDLPRRELCIVAACAATGQDRQLQSHLHGARNAGAGDDAIGETLDAIRDLIPDALSARAAHMWDKVR
jgi:4-carboxymuconolactone decarboxylase